jgi:DNA-binding response OmpR family regulator
MDRIKPNLVILDTTMTGSDSLQVLDLIREQSSVPVIMLTQDYEMESLRQAISHGADDFVRKPFGAKSFVARIRAKLRRARRQTV